MTPLPAGPAHPLGRVFDSLTDYSHKQIQIQQAKHTRQLPSLYMLLFSLVPLGPGD